MVDLYILGTRPRFLMVDGKITEMKTVWVSDEAKQMYAEYQAYLSRLFKRAIEGVDPNKLFGISVKDNGTLKPIRREDAYKNEYEQVRDEAIERYEPRTGVMNGPISLDNAQERIFQQHRLRMPGESEIILKEGK